MHHTKFSAALFTVLTAYYPFIRTLLGINLAKNGNLQAIFNESLFDVFKGSRGI
jgi:hypothetical protein